MGPLYAGWDNPPVTNWFPAIKKGVPEAYWTCWGPPYNGLIVIESLFTTSCSQHIPFETWVSLSHFSIYTWLLGPPGVVKKGGGCQNFRRPPGSATTQNDKEEKANYGCIRDYILPSYVVIIKIPIKQPVWLMVQVGDLRFFDRGTFIYWFLGPTL